MNKWLALLFLLSLPLLALSDPVFDLMEVFPLLNNSNSSFMKVSPNEERLLLTTGSIACIYDRFGEKFVEKSFHKQPIIGVDWFKKDNGPITVDGSGLIILWKSVNAQLPDVIEVNYSIKRVIFLESQNVVGVVLNNDTLFEFDLLSGRKLTTNYNLTTTTPVFYQRNGDYLFYIKNSSGPIYYLSRATSKLQETPIPNMTISQIFNSRLESLFMAATYSQYKRSITFFRPKLPSTQLTSYQLQSYKQTEAIIQCPDLSFAFAIPGVISFISNLSSLFEVREKHYRLAGKILLLECTQNYLIAVNQYGHLGVAGRKGFPYWIIPILSALFLILLSLSLYAWRKRQVKARKKSEFHPQCYPSEGGDGLITESSFSRTRKYNKMSEGASEVIRSDYRSSIEQMKMDVPDSSFRQANQDRINWKDIRK